MQMPAQDFLSELAIDRHIVGLLAYLLI